MSRIPNIEWTVLEFENGTFWTLSKPFSTNNLRHCVLFAVPGSELTPTFTVESIRERVHNLCVAKGIPFPTNYRIRRVEGILKEYMD